MKKAGLFFVCAVVLISLLAYGCSKSDSPASSTPTPKAASDLSIQAGIAPDPGLPTYNASVMLRLVSTSAGVSGATVTMNGQTLTEVTGAPGYYINANLTGITGGTVINLSITSTAGNVTGSVTMPSTNTIVFGTLSGGAVGSTYSATHN